MKKYLVLMVMGLTMFAAAGSAAAGSASKDPRVPALQRKVATLQAQVDQNAAVLNREIDLNTCQFTYQSHFNYGVLNIFATLLGVAPVQDQTMSDNGACSRVGITPPRFLAMQPARSPFASLVSLWSVVAR